MEEPGIIDRLWDNTRLFKSGLQALGFNTGASESPITPVIVGDGALAMKLSDRLFQEGVFAQGIAFPTVARDKARVRTIVTATHTRDELQFALGAVESHIHAWINVLIRNASVSCHPAVPFAWVVAEEVVGYPGRRAAALNLRQ